MGNRFIYDNKVSNRYIYDNKVSCFHIFLLFFCCVPILCWKSWSFLLVVEHHSVMCHPFHHFIKEICILVCWAILWSFSWAKYFFVCRDNGVGTHCDSEMCSHQRMNRIFQSTCTFWQGLFSLHIFRNILICNLSIFPVIFVT